MRAELGWCVLPLASATWLIRVDHMQYYLVDALSRQLKYRSRCANNTVCTFRLWFMLHAVGRCHLQDEKRQVSCMHALDDSACHWWKSLTKYSHSILVCGGLSWSRIPLAVIAFQMSTCHATCVKDFAYVFCFGWNLYTNVCRRRTMLAGNIQY